MAALAISAPGSAFQLDTPSVVSLKEQLSTLQDQLSLSQSRNGELESKLAALSDRRARTTSFGAVRTNGQIPVPSSPTKRMPAERSISNPLPPLDAAEIVRSPRPDSRASQHSAKLSISGRRARQSTGPHGSSFSQIPVAVVGAGRILTSSGPNSPRTSIGASPALDRSPDVLSSPAFSPTMSDGGFHSRASGLPRPASPAKSNARAGASANPFYGSGSGQFSTERHAARMSAAATGTSRVIDNLQAELAIARGGLEEAKAQLRLSQRAIESLNRQLTDASDMRDRAKAEIDTLQSRFQRKERMLEEVLHRARTAEASVYEATEGHTQAVKRAKELESRMIEAESRAAYDKARYEALRDGHSEMREGMQRQIAAVQKELADSKTQQGELLAVAKADYDKIMSNVHARESAAAQARAAVVSLEASREAISVEWQSRMAEIFEEAKRSTALNASAASQADELTTELKRIRLQMRNHATS